MAITKAMAAKAKRLAKKTGIGYRDAMSKLMSGTKKKAPAKKRAVSGSPKKKQVVQRKVTTVKRKTVNTRLAGMSGTAMQQMQQILRNVASVEKEIEALKKKQQGASAAERRQISGDIKKRKEYKVVLNKNKTSIKKFL